MGSFKEKTVLVGGGGGVYQIGRYLKQMREIIITLQTMFDHGGHSGQLRDERGILPSGDIRQGILAVAPPQVHEVLRVLMTYRFSENGSSIDNATVGNFMLAALCDTYGVVEGINKLCEVFHVAPGRVLPVSTEYADLRAVLSDGTILRNEGEIDTRSPNDDRTIERVYLEPKAHIYTEAYDALVNADKIVFCPGDPYTSVIPNLLTVGFSEAVSESRAQLIYVVNIMTKKAETDGYTASRFTNTLLSYLGAEKLDAVLCNTTRVPARLLEKYAAEKAAPVEVDEGRLRHITKHIVKGDFASFEGDIIRHNHKTASAIADL